MKTYIIGYLRIRTLNDKLVKQVQLSEGAIPVVLETGVEQKLLGAAGNVRLRNHLILADVDKNVDIPEGYKVTFGGVINFDVQHVDYLLVASEWIWGDLPNSLDEFNAKRCTLCNYTSCMYDCNKPVARVEI